MTKEENYKGYIFSWQEPPLMVGGWQGNVASNDRALYVRMCEKTKKHGAEVIIGRTREEMLAKAKAFIDGVLA